MRPKINTTYRSHNDMKSISVGATLEEVITGFNELVNDYNRFNKLLSFQSNFDGYIAEVYLAAGETKTISHFLGVIPKYRIILRQEGNGVISDIPSGWTDKAITIINNGVVAITATLLIARE